MRQGQKATDLATRCEQLRLSIIASHRDAGAGHLGSSLSLVEILTVLFHKYLRWPINGSQSVEGDRCVLSKGHAALGLYCALAAAGQLDSNRLKTFGRNGSPLEPHPNEHVEPAVHASTGSLGQGISIGVGMALGSRLRK